MKIKNRLSLYFTALSAIVLLIVEVGICIVFRSLIKSDFYDQLTYRANIAAQLYLEADEISADSLNHVRMRFLQPIPHEIVRFYDDRNAASFIKDKDPLWSAPVIDMVRKRKHLELAEGDRQTVGVYYNDNQGNFVILVSAPDQLGHKRWVDLVESLSILLITVTIGLFLISRWFAQTALSPIDRLITQIRGVRAGSLDTRVDEGNGRDEISALARNFNQLLVHLESAFELQQTFVTNASHELRTPITTIIGEIEITLNKMRPQAEYELVLHSVLNDAERLNETITSLLELAHVDMNSTQPSLKPVAIDELVWEMEEIWTRKMGKGFFMVNVLHLPAEQEKLQITANKPLVGIAFNNIISNAFKFSAGKPVKCELYADEENIRVSVIDQGIGIPPGEVDKIFTSFYRGTNVKQFSGNGIGLYVTNKIIGLYNGTISVNSQPGWGTTVTILFKR